MYKRCTSENAARLQREVESCLVRAMLKYSYQDIKVTSLCESSGLSRRNFYRLFDTKDDVLYALIDHAIVGYAGYTLPTDQVAPDISVELQSFFSYWYQQQPLLDALYKNKMSSLLVERIMMHVASEDGQTMRMIDADNHQNGTEKFVFFMQGFIGLVIYWHHSGYAKSINEMASIAQELFSTPPVRFPDLFKYL
ncbi:MAG: TetR/AcrR family transcriptional regulator [Oscillospiraceae bacterium]|nr:TetR/AcrR family transcriptional regulator [Oscillospiraceae bacterium]